MKLPKNRWEAFAAHFGISLLVFLGLLAIIIFFWYPGALFAAAGGWQGIRIVVGVDLVLGPFLTLIVYNLAKPPRLLYRDLLIIGVVQVSCLSLGVYIVYAARPVAVIYSIDKFYALKKSDFIAYGKDLKELSLSLMTPVYFHVNMGERSREEVALTNKISQFLGKELLFRKDLYQPLPQTMVEARKALRFNPASQDPSHPDRCLTAELSTTYSQGLVCFDPVNQRFEKFIAKSP